MNCISCQQLLSEYQDAELDEKISNDIGEHLKNCARCRQELDLLNKIMSAAKGLPRHQPGNMVILKIKSAIYGSAKTERQIQFGPVLDVNELAEFLRVDKKIIEQYLEEIPCFELGGKILFRRKSVEEWIENREQNFGFQMQRSRLNQILHN